MWRTKVQVSSEALSMHLKRGSSVVGSVMQFTKPTLLLDGGMAYPVEKALSGEVAGMPFVKVEAFETCNRRFFHLTDCGN